MPFFLKGVFMSINLKIDVILKVLSCMDKVLDFVIDLLMKFEKNA